ncbi:S1C family serine protease [Oscillibacter valericigenes]|uniref:S1C family serine protease n=1 Tax=Oscillibacter valericigenes TaxID=351091 RepID=UPI00195A5A7C|nr:trypsin-like peptidase domain-containing protein [Oscillibacter valericigenes]MBM6909973.1 trypsin-like peptidase domain-containing protein [Oscillibacter valericigenes]HJB75875.1 trypsin-like peptidase domain-containing protein [Candidatus Oscillibacter avistercoris]
MYNDEHNLYHYTYRKDGSETETHPAPQAGPAPEYQNGPQQPVQEMKPVKKNRVGMKLTALALCCALLGGAVGGGIVWGVSNSGEEDSTTINVSDRTVSQVAVNKVDGQTEMSDAEVYAANVNSVVSINVTGTSGTNWFGQPVQTASAGSGFILTSDGYIVTNYHVVGDAQTIQVTLYSGDTYDAQYVGGDEDYDIAVIKIEATGLQAVTLGNSEELNVGDHVLAIGNPLGELTFSMSGGMVSSVNRTINVDGTPFNMIQTDTSINPGNSGGPLLNSYGEVVGIVSAKYSSTGSNGETAEGLGFAIPINDVSSMIQDIMTNGYVSNRAYLGATIGTLNASMAQQYRYDITEGAFVYSVEDGGPADQAGLQLGDVITAIDDTEITSLDDLTAARKSYTAGDTCTLTVYRQGETITLQLTWGAAPAEQQAESQSQTQQDNSQSGGYIDPNDLFNYFFG